MYKGSSKPNIKIFNPEPVVAEDIGTLKHAGLDADKVIWVSDRKEYALPFAMLFGKVRFSVFFKEGEKPTLSISTIDAKEKLHLDEKIYLYELEDADYIKTRGPEYVSLNPVKVINIEEFTMREVFHMFQVYIPQKWELR